MKTISRRSALFLPLALAGCGDFFGSDDSKKPIPGDAIAVLPPVNALEANPAAQPVTLPPSAAPDAWPQTLGNAAHATGNLAASLNFDQVWSASIGAGGGYRQALHASPVAADGQVYTMDTNGTVVAFKLDTGEQIWSADTRPKHGGPVDIGGGLALANGRVYASTGYGELLALDTGSGNILWRSPLDFPARSAPAIGGGVVAVLADNGVLDTFDPASGAAGWRYAGRTQATSAFSYATPAIDAGVLVAGFQDGGLLGFNVATGNALWAQSLASSFGAATPLDFSAIVAPPVIAGGIAYAASISNTMMAVDIRSGETVWQHRAGGAQAFAAAGAFVFVVDSEQRVAALAAETGIVSWTADLPAYGNPKKQKNPILWAGPLIADGKLLLLSTDGQRATIDAVTGKILSIDKTGQAADLTPIVVGGLTLVLTRDGTLTAYN